MFTNIYEEYAKLRQNEALLENESIDKIDG